MIKIDDEKQPLGNFDPDSYSGPIYTADMIRGRAAEIERALSTFPVGLSAYGDVMRMEIWALRYAATVLEIQRGALVDEARMATLELSNDDLDKMVMVAAREMGNALQNAKGGTHEQASLSPAPVADLGRTGDVGGPDLADVEIAAGQHWRHKKRGGVYELVATDARVQVPEWVEARNALERDRWVVYRALYDGDTLFVRMRDEFLDGRFELVAQ